jgi:hypothetical protein
LCLNYEIAVSLASHVLRHAVLPSALEGLDGCRALITLRSGENDSVESRSLFHFPEGVWVRGSDDRTVQVHPPGWYWIGNDWASTDAVRNLWPVDATRKVLRRIHEYLRRFPRSTHPPQHEELPPYVAHIFGFYWSDLVQLAMGLIIRAAEASNPRLGQRLA